MKKYLDDILYVCGCGLIIYATYLLSFIAALYVGGGLLIVAGVLVSLGGKKE